MKYFRAMRYYYWYCYQYCIILIEVYLALQKTLWLSFVALIRDDSMDISRVCGTYMLQAARLRPMQQAAATAPEQLYSLIVFVIIKYEHSRQDRCVRCSLSIITVSPQLMFYHHHLSSFLSLCDCVLLTACGIAPRIVNFGKFLRALLLAESIFSRVISWWYTKCYRSIDSN